ncbi:MAG: ATP-binding cassette domain-containing protein [Flavobacteriales bacterium]|nr:ATP-binding cassette domain-containing protein [Flavobacteriales bacterium]
MEIHLNQVLPVPMKDQSFSPDSIWRNSITFVQSGDALVLAPSGTGKTSLLSFLFGMRSDYKGEIRIDGKNIRSFSLNDWAEIRQRKISMVMQDLRLIPTLTVEENLRIKNRLSNQFSIEEIKEMLSRVGLADKWQQRCGTLSIGQQQRVSIVRALLQPYQWLFLDEPFSHIDNDNIFKAAELIREISLKNGASVLMVSLGSDFNLSFNQKYKL